MYLIYLDKVLFPVMPDTIKLQIMDKNKTLDISSGGQIVIPKSPGLTKVAFTLKLPTRKQSYAAYENGFLSPQYYLGKLEELKTSGKPFELQIIRYVTASAVLRAAAKVGGGSVSSLFDLNGDGKVDANDARIVLLSAENDPQYLLDPTDLTVVLSSYDVTEKAEDGNDFTVDVKLTQYREYGLKTVTYEVKS